MTDMSGYEKMRSGQLYSMPDAYLIGLQIEAREGLVAYNATPMREMERRTAILREQLGSIGHSFVLSPVTWEYGRHIHLGDRIFINFECIFLDGADIRIGNGTMVAPRVQFLTSGHPVDPAERARIDPATGQHIGGYCVNKPITVGSNCWIGAAALIMGGVTIGDGTTIGAGSVVTRDIPAGVVAAGNPCRVIRSATEKPKKAANLA